MNRKPLSRKPDKGVWWHAGKWRTGIQCKGKKIYLGRFREKEKALLVYSLATKRYFREYAYKSSEDVGIK